MTTKIVNKCVATSLNVNKSSTNSMVKACQKKYGTMNELFDGGFAITDEISHFDPPKNKP